MFTWLSFGSAATLISGSVFGRRQQIIYAYVGGNPLGLFDQFGLMGGGAGDSRKTNDWGKFASSWWESFSAINGAVYGIAAPTGLTLFTGRAAANAIGGMTFVDLLLGFVNGTLGIVAGDVAAVGATYGAVGLFAKTALMNALTVNLGFELGLGVGIIPSALEASLVPLVSCPR